MASQLLELEFGVYQVLPLLADKSDLHDIADRQMGEDLQVNF